MMRLEMGIYSEYGSAAPKKTTKLQKKKKTFTVLGGGR